MKASEVLRASFALLEKPGAWGQAVSEVPGLAPKFPDGCHCMVTAPKAMTLACWDYKRPPREEWEAIERAEAYMARVLGVRPLLGIIRWNDTPGRTLAEVLDVVRQAAELAESEGQ